MNLFRTIISNVNDEGKLRSGLWKYLPILGIIFFLALGGGRGDQAPGRGLTLEKETSGVVEETVVETAVESTTAAALPVEQAVTPMESVSESTGRVTVYVCGAVRCPGVYTLESFSRVTDAIHAAGGFLEDADCEYWNLAEPLADGEQIRIPSCSESETMESRETVIRAAAPTASGGGSSGSSGSSEGGLVNINTATKEQLMTLNGIGEVKASAIIAYREENGAFRSIEDVMNVSGIKEGSFAKIKAYITV